MRNLLETIRYNIRANAIKHELCNFNDIDDYTNKEINKLTNVELLELISYFMEDSLKQEI